MEKITNYYKMFIRKLVGNPSYLGVTKVMDVFFKIVNMLIANKFPN